MSRKTRHFKVSKGSEELTVTKMGKFWSCSCKKEDCEHIQICKLEVLLEKRNRRGKVEKPVYHFHDLMRVRKEVLLLLKVEGVRETSARWRFAKDLLSDTKALVSSDILKRRRASGKAKKRTSASVFVSRAADFVVFLPGITKKRLREIYLEFMSQYEERAVSRGKEELRKRQAEKPWPMRMSPVHYRRLPLPGVQIPGDVEGDSREIKSKLFSEIENKFGRPGVNGSRAGIAISCAARKKLERLLGADSLVPAVFPKHTWWIGSKEVIDDTYIDTGYTPYVSIKAYIKDGKIVFSMRIGGSHIGAK